MKLDYVLRETSSNLGRNFTITLASVMTVAVSLALVGASLMLRTGVENATQRWQGGIEFVVFLRPDASADQIAAIARDLEDSPDVADIEFVDKEAAFEEFKVLFSDSPEMVTSVQPEDLPPSFRVEPVDKDVLAVEALGSQFADKSGVDSVVFASETIRLIQQLSSRLTVGIFVIAAFLLGAAGLLILNTIRMAMFARRREIEVMKLVGATNWFIRVPFMLEGLVQGVLGALAAILALAVFKPFFQEWLPNPEDFPLVSGFLVSGGELAAIFVLLGVVGILIGAVGAGIAVTRFLDV
ncbi:MAG: ABC transporter permease [Acidimicrobiales bacterium]|jgi:cell division transport system permease protein|nr:ABC transporter permease [Acidimicrobiales bacterium]